MPRWRRPLAFLAAGAFVVRPGAPELPWDLEDVLLRLPVAEHSDKTVVVTMANYAMREALLAWVLSVHAFGERRYVVLASDPATLGVCRENALPCAYDSRLQLHSGELRYGMTPDFLAMGKVRFGYTLRLLHLGYAVLFSELDVLWVEHPIARAAPPAAPEFSRIIPSENYDLQIQPNAHLKASLYRGQELNVGFFYVRSTAAAILLIQKTLQTMAEETGAASWEQSVFSRMAWRLTGPWTQDSHIYGRVAHAPRTSAKSAPLRLHLLSTWYFPTGGVGRKPIVPVSAYRQNGTRPTVVHCTGRTGVVPKRECMDAWRNAVAGLKKHKTASLCRAGRVQGRDGSRDRGASAPPC